MAKKNYEKLEELHEKSKSGEISAVEHDVFSKPHYEKIEKEISSGKQDLWTHKLKHKDSMWKHLNRQAPKKW